MHTPNSAALVRPGALAFALAASLSALAAAPPVAEKKPVTDTHHGTSVSEDYRWLEDWSNPAVKAWSEAQNTHARAHLEALPSVPEIRARLTTLMGEDGVDFSHVQVRKGRLFALRHDPKQQQPVIVELRALSDDPANISRTIVDPNLRDPTGLTTIDWYEISPDGKLAAVSLSEGGSESGTLHVFAIDAGCETGDVIKRVHGGTAGGSLAWRPDNTGFYYTRYPREGERPDEDKDFFVQVYSHKLGDDPAHDTYEVGRTFPRIAEIVLETNPRGDVLASVQNGDGGDFAHFQGGVGQGNKWVQLTVFDEGIKHAILDGKGGIYAVSRKDAPRGSVVRIFALTGKPTTDAALLRAEKAEHPTIIPVSHGDASIETDFFAKTGLMLLDSCLFVWYQNGGPNEVRVYDLARSGSVWSKFIGVLPAPPASAIGEIAPGVEKGTILFQTQSYIDPPAWVFAVPTSLDSGAPKFETRFKKQTPADYSDCEVVREFAISKDGTRVPLSIIRKKGLGHALDNGLTPSNGAPRVLKAEQKGSDGLPGWQLPAPTILWGYGGYGVCESPVFSPRRRLFIEQGGVFVVANIRGGGEYGEEWHLSGNLTKKQNVFDDYAAAARHLIARGYTDRDHLCLMGGSNGGLLMGATFTQNPDLARCVVSSVGIYDMLRVELSSNGAFNIPEFGTVKDKAQFEALYAYSPLHRVKDGTVYPSILFMTGANDPRVDPMQSRKMTARLQAASPRSITLLRTSASSGHGVGSSLTQRIEESVDIYAFIFKELGVSYQPVRPTARAGVGSGR
ncbi:MAG: prolyl oligopeptidase family serine peptidase [Phycisphaerales bacterium]